MKFTIPKTQLSELVSQIQGVVPNRPTIPILSNFLIEANADGLTLKASDMTVSMECKLSTQVEQFGSITLPSKRFFQLIRELTSPDIEIEVSDNNICNVHSLSSQFKIHGMSTQDYPAFPGVENSTKIRIKTTALKGMINKTSFCASRDENRYLMTGLLFRIENSKLVVVGTDARRLAKVETPIEVDPSLSKEYIVPLKGIEEISKVLDKTKEEEVSLYLGDDRLAVETADTVLTTKLLLGDFPDFKSVIPQTTQFTVSLHREELTGLLKQISIFANDSGACQFTLSSGELTLSSSHHEIGEGRVSMPVDYNQEPFEIFFNPAHLLDVFRHLADETVEMRFVDSLNPVIVKDGLAGLYIIMPMRKQ